MRVAPRVRLLALDVDGTLLTSDHRVSDSTRHAVCAASRAGADVVLASSRGPNGLYPVFSELGTGSLAIAYQGALLCRLHLANGVEVISERRLPIDIAQWVISSAADRGLSVGWYTAEHWKVPHLDGAISLEAKITGEKPIVTDAPVEAKDSPHKVLVIAGSPHRVSTLRSLASRLPEGCEGQFSHENYLEVTSRGVDKSMSLNELVQQLGIAQEETVAIGDGANDIGMLQWAGLGICMGQALDAVKMVTDMVTGTNDQDGVAKAVEELQRQGRL